MRTSRIAMLGWSTVAACAGCSSASAVEAPQACVECERPPPDPINVLMVENRTDHAVEIAQSDAQIPTVVARRIIDRSLAVAIAPELRGPFRQLTIAVGDTITIGRRLNVLDEKIVPANGAVLRTKDGPPLLAIGNGRILVRTRDGKDVLEEQDPRAAILIPADHELPACAPSAYGDLLPERPPQIDAGGWMTVSAVERDADRCRLFQLNGPDGRVTYRACIPDVAYPFGDTDTIVASPTDSSGIHFGNGTRAALDLLPLRFETRASLNAARIAFAYSEEPTCATIETTCADVDLPAKLRIAFEGQPAQTLAVGDSAVDPENANRTLFFLGARSRPVFASICPARGKTFSPTEMLVAIVHKS